MLKLNNLDLTKKITSYKVTMRNVERFSETMEDGNEITDYVAMAKPTISVGLGNVDSALLNKIMTEIRKKEIEVTYFAGGNIVDTLHVGESVECEFIYKDRHTEYYNLSFELRK